MPISVSLSQIGGFDEEGGDGVQNMELVMAGGAYRILPAARCDRSRFTRELGIECTSAFRAQFDEKSFQRSTGRRNHALPPTRRNGEALRKPLPAHPVVAPWILRIGFASRLVMACRARTQSVALMRESSAAVVRPRACVVPSIADGCNTSRSPLSVTKSAG